MRLYRLINPDAFDDHPELAMGVQIGRSGNRGLIVIGGLVVLQPDKQPDEESEISRGYLSLPWLQADLAREKRIGIFESWLEALPCYDCEPATAEEILPLLRDSPQKTFAERMLLAYIVGPLTPLPPAPGVSPSLHGHLPFGTRTSNRSIFYRWEAFPSPSRRIVLNQGKTTILRDTYAAPASEAPFVPSGFAAVARFALPSLMPACFRYELQPVAGTFIECGASVPLYGQAGGGVEVRFPQLTTNRCAVADPVILDAM